MTNPLLKSTMLMIALFSGTRTSALCFAPYPIAIPLLKSLQLSFAGIFYYQRAKEQGEPWSVCLLPLLHALELVDET